MLNSHPSLAERLKLYEIDSGTMAMARQFWHAVHPEFHLITHRFYAHLGASPETARFLPGQPGIEHLRAAQAAHWEDLFTGHFDASYIERINHTAEAHLRIRLPNYYYMAAYAFFLNELVAKVLALFPDEEERCSMIPAINKLVLFDMDMTMSFYMQRLMRGGPKEAARITGKAQANA